MDWRFRKSFKLLPGFRLNIGKKGITSATVGERGFTTSIGKLGIFQNLGIPGTGLVAILAVLMVIFSSVAILQVEDDPASNIKTAEDAIWWAYVTITTVGYGDKYPVTTEGRIIAAFLMTTGVGLFGTFTGFVASWFVDGRQEEHEKEERKEA
mgnify:CR=1 FL=1